MNKFLILLLLGFLLVSYSCQKAVEKQINLKIIPSPQHFEARGISQLKFESVEYYYAPEGVTPPECTLFSQIQPTAVKSEAQIVFAIDSLQDVPAEGYSLKISKKQIKISGKDAAGLLYAFMALEQILEDAKGQGVYLPVCSIKDYPLLPYRAIHLDLKHHIDKTGYYYKLLDKLAKYKVNAIIVEFEDKLQYARQPGIGSADALSITEWKKLSKYAKDRNIEISPLVQGLGHASFILKHDKYKKLRDNSQSDWAFNPLDPETYEVQSDLYLDAMEATPYGRYLHVGGDEVTTTGRNSGKTPLELQLVWLKKVCGFAEKHGRTPVFWDDMPLKQANVYRPMFNTNLSGQEVDSIWEVNGGNLKTFLGQFPKNCIYMRWNYDCPQAIGNIKAMDWFLANGLQAMGATAGQTTWALMPQNGSNISNIKSFAGISANKGLDGLLLTLWDDQSPHFELYTRGIIAFAEYTWAGGEMPEESIKSAYRHREFSHGLADTQYAFIDKLEKPVAFWENALLENTSRRRLKKHGNPIEEAIIDLPDKNNKGGWSRKYAGRLEEAALILQQCDTVAAIISSMKPKALRNLYTLEVYEEVNKLAQFSPKVLLALKGYDTADTPQQEAHAINQIRQLPEEFMALREELEKVYSQTRILEKPEGYILDQDHHSHLANQAITFDWQFLAEILFIEKLKKLWYEN